MRGNDGGVWKTGTKPWDAGGWINGGRWEQGLEFGNRFCPQKVGPSLRSLRMTNANLTGVTLLVHHSRSVIPGDIAGEDASNLTSPGMRVGFLNPGLDVRT